MNISLPFEKIKPASSSPKRMLIFSSPKVGKTSMLAQLPNSLLIDLESGASHYEGAYIDIPQQASVLGKGPITTLKEVAKAITAKNAELGKPAYDFIIVDTLTVMEDLATSLATSNYKKSAQGINFKGTNVVREMPNGYGYEWLRGAFEELYTLFDGLAGKCIIFTGHTKLTSTLKDGESIQAKDVQLTGKIKLMVNSSVDSIAHLYRDKTTQQNKLSFKNEETDLATGSRIPHLTGKEFVISEMKESVLTTYWEEIFPSLKA
jgi:hypothetical protein